MKSIGRAFEVCTSNSSKLITEALKSTTRNHFMWRYPGSTHYSPNKVVDGVGRQSQTSASGEVIIQVPGVTRAYRDITIVPIARKFLTIPTHVSAYGKQARDFTDLFSIKGKNGLFRKEGTSIVMMFALAKKAFQKQDRTLMPDDTTLLKNVGSRFLKYVDSEVDRQIKTI